MNTKEDRESKRLKKNNKDANQINASFDINAKNQENQNSNACLSKSKSEPKPAQSIRDKKDELDKKESADLLDAQEEIARSKDQFLRLAAEFDNYKKRQLNQNNLREKYFNESIAKDLFSVLDSLEIALNHITDDKNSKNFEECAKGIKLVHQQFLDVLKQHHIEKMSTLGEIFDPEKHEAVATLETAKIEANKVTAVFKAGYLLHDRIIRPAMVQVSKAKTNNASRV